MNASVKTVSIKNKMISNELHFGLIAVCGGSVVINMKKANYSGPDGSKRRCEQVFCVIFECKDS